MKILGALIIVLAGSLLFIGKDWMITINRWGITAIVIGGLCGIAFNWKKLAKTSGYYLILVSIMSAIVLSVTRDVWIHGCFGGLVPVGVLILPLLSAIVIFVISALIMFVINSITKRKQEKKVFQNIENQE